jgi:hypothetical protein
MHPAAPPHEAGYQCPESSYGPSLPPGVSTLAATGLETRGHAGGSSNGHDRTMVAARPGKAAAVAHHADGIPSQNHASRGMGAPASWATMPPVPIVPWLSLK